MQPRLVFKNGQKVSEQGEYIGPTLAFTGKPDNTVHVAPLDASALQLRLSQPTVPVMRLHSGQLVTTLETRAVAHSQGCWTWQADADVLLIASVERHKQLGTVGLGLVSGFGLRQPGALASSVAHDAHNLIVAGTNAADMLLAIQHLQQTGGGFVVASHGEIRACLPLPFAGLLATKPAEVVIRELQAVEQAAQSLGCNIPCPFGALSFLALPVIPEVKITDQGMFHVGEQRFLTY
jgi:adenine deaminase